MKIITSSPLKQRKNLSPGVSQIVTHETFQQKFMPPRTAPVIMSDINLMFQVSLQLDWSRNFLFFASRVLPHKAQTSAELRNQPRDYSFAIRRIIENHDPNLTFPSPWAEKAKKTPNFPRFMLAASHVMYICCCFYFYAATASVLSRIINIKWSWNITHCQKCLWLTFRY